MKVLEDLISNMNSHLVEDVCIGAFSTFVLSKNCGLSTTQRENKCTRQRTKDSGSLIRKDVKELAEYVLSDNLIEASLGMAAINSALPVEREKLIHLNAKELIRKKGKGKTVCVIGNFPFFDKIKIEFEKFFIFERNPRDDELLEKDIPEYLPQADVIALTATSFINHTFEDILKHARKDAFTVVLGPSTPLSPLLFDYGADALSGSLVRDIPSVIAQVKEATPFRFVKGVEHLTLLKE